MEDVNEALKQTEAAARLKLAQRAQEDLYFLASLFVKNQHFTEACHTYEKLIERFPNERRARRELANLLHNLGRFDEAEDHYRKLLQPEAPARQAASELNFRAS